MKIKILKEEKIIEEKNIELPFFYSNNPEMAENKKQIAVIGCINLSEHWQGTSMTDKNDKNLFNININKAKCNKEVELDYDLFISQCTREVFNGIYNKYFIQKIQAGFLLQLK